MQKCDRVTGILCVFVSIYNSFKMLLYVLKTVDEDDIDRSDISSGKLLILR